MTYAPMPNFLPSYKLKRPAGISLFFSLFSFSVARRFCDNVISSPFGREGEVPQVESQFTFHTQLQIILLDRRIRFTFDSHLQFLLEGLWRHVRRKGRTSNQLPCAFGFEASEFRWHVTDDKSSFSSFQWFYFVPFDAFYNTLFGRFMEDVHRLRSAQPKSFTDLIVQ